MTIGLNAQGERFGDATLSSCSSELDRTLTETTSPHCSASIERPHLSAGLEQLESFPVAIFPMKGAEGMLSAIGSLPPVTAKLSEKRRREHATMRESYKIPDTIFASMTSRRSPPRETRKHLDLHFDVNQTILMSDKAMPASV